jgi:tetratricopeptide (TPR) repeat protein
MTMRVRMNLMQWSLVVLPLLSAAQTRPLITSARSGDTVRQSKPVRSVEETFANDAGTTVTEAVEVNQASLNILPLFGERTKTAGQIDQEIHFLNDCDRNFGSRSEASTFFATRGWDYIADGQLDTAAYRFNLSWLLNDKNVDVYWGLGVVCYQKDHLVDAIRMLKKGLAVADSNLVLLTDLATVEIKHYQQKQQQATLNDAQTHLSQAISIKPNATAYQKLSLISFLRADYAKAWDYFHQAREIDLSQLDLNYLNDLLAKLPDPQGVFK